MTSTNWDVAQDIGLINRNIGPGVAASIDSHLASFQMVKAVRNAPSTHFNVCNKCSWLNTWHYGRSFPMTMGLPRHSWFSNLEEAANNSCQLCASLLKYCQWSHVGRLSIHMHHRHDLVMTWITWRLLAPKVTNNGQDTTMDSTWTTPGQCFM